MGKLLLEAFDHSFDVDADDVVRESPFEQLFGATEATCEREVGEVVPAFLSARFQ